MLLRTPVSAALHAKTAGVPQREGLTTRATPLRTLDPPQAILGFMAFICAAIYALVTDPHPFADMSKGFALDLGGNVTALTPGFKGPLDCAPDKFGNPTCDNYAYPVGDHAVFPGAMTEVDAYAPFPNAIFLNCGRRGAGAWVGRLGVGGAPFAVRSLCRGVRGAGRDSCAGSKGVQGATPHTQTLLTRANARRLLNLSNQQG